MLIFHVKEEFFLHATLSFISNRFRFKVGTKDAGHQRNSHTV